MNLKIKRVTERLHDTGNIVHSTQKTLKVADPSVALSLTTLHKQPSTHIKSWYTATIHPNESNRHITMRDSSIRMFDNPTDDTKTNNKLKKSIKMLEDSDS